MVKIEYIWAVYYERDPKFQTKLTSFKLISIIISSTILLEIISNMIVPHDYYKVMKKVSKKKKTLFKMKWNISDIISTKPLRERGY